jgi:RNA polymerase sigma factor (TIGR02999 family)
MKDSRATVTRLLGNVERGDRAAVDDLFTIVYENLHVIAARQRRRWHGDDTLNTTALVHEAWVKLVDARNVSVESSGHFFALAARAMRQILCNYARDRRTQKRGGRLEHVSLGAAAIPGASTGSLGQSDDRILALDEALRRLEQAYPRPSRVVECRFFGGLTIDETAAALGIAPRTVKRDWALAQAWLHREIETGNDA